LTDALGRFLLSYSKTGTVGSYSQLHRLKLKFQTNPCQETLIKLSTDYLVYQTFPGTTSATYRLHL